MFQFGHRQYQSWVVVVVLCTALHFDGCFAARPLEAPGSQIRPGDSKSVLLYGADPSGKTDSTRAFQQAVDSCDRVSVPAGLYSLSWPVILRNGVTISATPNTAVLIAGRYNSSAQGGLIFVGINLVSVNVSGLSFDGALQYIHDNHKRLVYINGARQVVFDHVAFENAAGPALVFSGTRGRPVSSSGVRRSSFKNIGRAWEGRTDVSLSDAASALVFSNGSATSNQDNFSTDNYFTGIGADAVDIQSQGRFEASRNRIDLKEQGWRPTSTSKVTFGVGGMYVYGASNGVRVVGNDIEGATGNCVDIAETNGIIVEHNIIATCGGAGISLADIQGLKLADNQIRDTNRSVNYDVENRVHSGGISLGCGIAPCAGYVQDGEMSENTFETRESRPIEKAEIWIQNGVVAKNIDIHNNKTTSGLPVAVFKEHQAP